MTHPRAPKPRAISRPSDLPSDGDALEGTARLLGVELWPWQRQVASVALERDGERWRFPIVTVCVPRQSGKSMLAGLVMLHRCLTQPGAAVWFSAQSRADAVQRWKDYVRLLRASGLVELPSKARGDGQEWDYRVRSGAGQEAVLFANGSELQPFAPAADSLHGGTTDAIVLDEVRFHDATRGAELLAAALPTQSTRSGQVWLVSTSGGPLSTFLADQLEAGRAGLEEPGSPRFLAEWGISDDAAEYDGTDHAELLEQVWAAHPSAGLPGGVRREALEVALGAMGPEDFRREYGNVGVGAGHQLLAEMIWADGRLPMPLAPGQPVFAADVALARDHAVIVASVAGDLEVVDERPGAGWLAGRLVELAGRHAPRAVVLDGGGPASNVAAAVKPALPGLVVTNSRQLAAASGDFYDGFADGLVRHRRHRLMDAAVAGAVQRRSGDAWTWSRAGAAGHVLVAMSLARWADLNADELVGRPPERAKVF